MLKIIALSRGIINWNWILRRSMIFWKTILFLVRRRLFISINTHFFFTLLLEDRFFSACSRFRSTFCITLERVLLFQCSCEFSNDLFCFSFFLIKNYFFLFISTIKTSKALNSSALVGSASIFIISTSFSSFRAFALYSSTALANY